MNNIDLVATLYQALIQMNVNDLIICAGARNLPIIEALQATTHFQIESYFEERSAGFYALGKMKSAYKPIAVIVTSGTAVAELLPAVIEAHYQNLPLIIVSADRPKAYRGTGSPQSIQHIGIFSSYVESVCDWDVATTQFQIKYSGVKPVHINVCFDEPLTDGNLVDAKSELVEILQPQKNSKVQSKILIKNPVAIISELGVSDRLWVQNFLIKNKIIHYAEFLSGLRNNPELLDLQIQSSDQFVKNIFIENKADAVMRIGGIPTLRFWRDLEFDFKNLPVYSFSRTEFSGLSRKCQLFDLELLLNIKIQTDQVVELSADRVLLTEKIKLLAELKNSEQNLISVLSGIISSQPLYVGNSQPIRMWDGFSGQAQKNQLVYANRGANGIDGQISTYLGWAQNKSESWCIVGDLTTLYDLAALGLAAQSKNKFRIVVINNLGGQIFSRLFGNQKYLNSQKVDFKMWALMWGWDYILLSNETEFEKLKFISNERLIIEIRPDNAQTEVFWKKWDLFCKK